jgi:hypothetical protein
VARLFGRLFGGRARTLARARAAELRGDLAEAAELFGLAQSLDEAARVMVLRGDAESDPSARLRHYVQAVAIAREGGAIHAHALRKRAMLLLELARGGPPPTALGRRELAAAARDLEALGEMEAAAEAYAGAGDVAGQVRVLARSGSVDRLDALLVEQQAADRKARAQRDALAEFGALLASGRRREAVRIALASDDDSLRDRARTVQAARADANVVRVVAAGRAFSIVLGERVVVGRSPAGPGAEAGLGWIRIGSEALSRRHLEVARDGNDVVARDLNSKNGTFLRGLRLATEACMGSRLELHLGGEVPLVVSPTGDMPGAAAIEVGGVRYVAPLGPAALGVGAWRLERASDAWIELVTDDNPPAYAGALQLTPRIPLLNGDAFATERGGEPKLVVEG